ncbi:unnamed protein product [Notodromas monacha]|uniref:beta-glucosidase n=1 Tax=Notodromas monacha TaxID=399045 RepID=A0A7R9C1F0_9CRUS|nr:unnamed protein product [Notodromas monacha]CAG0924706.1 unnamed protein product [Notodromas monacha]
MQFTLGWFAHPIFKDGNYPQIMIDQIGEKSKLQGFPQSRLPIFTREERKQLLGSSDFIGLNHYTSKVVSHAVGNHEVVSCAEDRDVKLDYDPTWPNSGSVWLRPVPPGMRMLLNWVKDEYRNLPVYITENGVSDTAGNLDDLHRMYYYKHFINNVLKAITLDGCKVEGYYAWSLMDSFEWTVGYSEKFGVCAVDFADKNRRRTMKSSAHFLRRIFADNGFLKDGNPWYDVPDAKHYTGQR